MTSSKRITPKALIITFIIISLAFWLYWSTRNTTLYNPNKNEVRAGVQAAMDAAKFPGEPALSSLDDKGCETNTIGFLPSFKCDFFAYKYFRGQGNLALDLKTASAVLGRSGWDWRPEPRDIRGLSFDLHVRDRLPVRYKHQGDPILYAELGFKDDSGKSGSLGAIEDLIGANRLSSPQHGEYVYGIIIHAEYWSCANISFFKQPCPAPPSKPHL